MCTDRLRPVLRMLGLCGGLGIRLLGLVCWDRHLLTQVACCVCCKPNLVLCLFRDRDLRIGVYGVLLLPVDGIEDICCFVVVSSFRIGLV